MAAHSGFLLWALAKCVRSDLLPALSLGGCDTPGYLPQHGRWIISTGIQASWSSRFPCLKWALLYLARGLTSCRHWWLGTLPWDYSGRHWRLWKIVRFLPWWHCFDGLQARYWKCRSWIWSIWGKVWVRVSLGHLRSDAQGLGDPLGRSDECSPPNAWCLFCWGSSKFLLIMLAGKLLIFSIHSLVTKKLDWCKRGLDVLVGILLFYVLLI